MRRAPGPALATALLIGLAACTDFPEIDAANRGAGPVGPAPALLPFAELERATSGSARPTETVESLEARAAALRARAAILRQPVRAAEDIDALRARLARLP